MSRRQLRDEVRALGRRVGISQEIFESVMEKYAEEEEEEGPTSPGSDISVSLRSSLFDDDAGSETGSLPGLETSMGSINPAMVFGASSFGPGANVHEQVSALKHEKRLLEMDYDRALARAKKQLLDTSKRYQAEIRKLKAELNHAREELPTLKQRLQYLRADFEDLHCPASVYDELSKMDKGSLSLRELVLMKVYELQSAQRAHIASLASELSQAKTTATDCKSEAEEARRTLSRLEVSYREKISALEKELQAAKGQADANKQKYLDSLREIDSMHENSQMYGALRSRCDDLERARTSALTQLEISQTNLRSMEQQMALKTDELQSALQQLELVKVDKSYLKREVEDGKREILRLEQALDRERDTVGALQQRMENDREQLYDAKENAKTEYELRLQREIESMREENQRQLAMLKETQLATSEREVRSLRTAREEAIVEVEHYRNKNQQLQQRLEETKDELSIQLASHQSELADLRTQLNTRIFETETLTNTLEEKLSSMRKLELENEMLSSKLEVLRSDFNTLETTSAKELVELNAKIATQEEKLNIYEQLEMEMDMAVMDKARHSDENDDGSDNVDDVKRITNVVGNEEQLLPIAAQRRVKHSVLLAQKLVKAERELELCKNECREKQSAIDLLKKKLLDAQNETSLSQQPQSYLVEKIQKLEKQLADSRTHVQQLIDQTKDVENKLKQTTETRNKLYEDLQAVLNDRKALEEAVQEQLHKTNAITVEDIATSPLELGRLSPTGFSPQQQQPRSPFHEGSDDEFEQGIVQEVDLPDSHLLDSTAHSVASVESSSFILHKQDDDGIPLPKWYRKLRQSSQN